MSSKKQTDKPSDRARQQAQAEIQARIDRLDAAEAPVAKESPAEAAPPETPATEPIVAGPADAGSSNGQHKGKKGAKAKTPKAPKPEKAPKAPKPPKEKKPKKASLLDCAATILASAKEPMSAKEIVADVLNKKLWSTKGETPEATLYAAMIREIAAKKSEARFKKVDRGMFVATAHAAK